MFDEYLNLNENRINPFLTFFSAKTLKLRNCVEGIHWFLAFNKALEMVEQSDCESSGETSDERSICGINYQFGAHGPGKM